MLALFLLPRGLFIPITFVATSLMVATAYASGAPKRPAGLGRNLLVGVASALLLYLVFYLGNAGLWVLKPLGLDPSYQSSIYSLIASPSNPLSLQLAVLLFDAAGYEAFFRGFMQKRLEARLGTAAAPAVALVDAGLHLATFNPLWVATTFVADLFWGLTFKYGRGATASFTSHLLWDVAIFVIRPIV
ncbi:MAG: CPBP family intramembrane metalloprotease [archaeon]|nr:MAG: CPBP family intramembrane metalloprotease [archaeon]